MHLYHSYNVVKCGEHMVKSKCLCHYFSLGVLKLINKRHLVSLNVGKGFEVSLKQLMQYHLLGDVEKLHSSRLHLEVQ